MEISKLSWYYATACNRVHTVVDEFYESVHTEEGLPQECRDVIDQAMERVTVNIEEELSLIKSALDEHLESK
tara:strand:+ start:5048 stop:5263 length:216 start_codon:yes stop_codon:yes gene_type:complete